MRLYKVIWQDNEEGGCVTWVSSLLEGRATIAEARRVAKYNGTVSECFEIIPVDFKPTKAGILALLRTTPDHDNG